MFDRRSIYSECADKIAVKERVKNTIDEEYVIPTLAVYNDFRELNETNLPDVPVIVKTNHDSGGARVIMDKSQCDFGELQRHVGAKLSRISSMGILNGNTRI